MQHKLAVGCLAALLILAARTLHTPFRETGFPVDSLHYTVNSRGQNPAGHSHRALRHSTVLCRSQTASTAATVISNSA